MKVVARMILEPGMILGEPIYFQKRLLFDADTVLDETTIALLARYNIMCVTIKEPMDFATSHYERVRLSEGFQTFDQLYQKYFPAYKSILYHFIEHHMPIDTNQLIKIYKLITKDVKTLELRLEYLYHRLPSEDDITYEHCLNCAIICGVFGSWWKMSNEDLTTLILCGFLFDIGKLKLPEDLLWKTKRLTDFEFNWIKTHTTLGYDLLKNEAINPHILNAVIMHHERKNGTGYPAHLVESQIDRFARYIAIVDSYDAMTCPRSYRTSMPILDVIDNFEKTGYNSYGMEFILPIVINLSASQVGKKVRLSNNQTGTITSISPLSYGKAVVTTENETIDLFKNKNITITQYL